MNKPNAHHNPDVKLPPGVRSIPWDDTDGVSWGDSYLGSAQDLIAAGLVTPDQLPGRPGSNKVSCTFYRGEPVRSGSNRPRDENYLNVVLRASARHGVRYLVHRGVPKEVTKQRLDFARARREEGRREADEGSLHETAGQYRGFRVNFAQALRDCFVQPHRETEWTFAEDVVDEIVELLDELIDLMRSGDIFARRPARAECPGMQAARADAAFQEFLALQGFRDLPADSGEV